MPTWYWIAWVEWEDQKEFFSPNDLIVFNQKRNPHFNSRLLVYMQRMLYMRQNNGFSGKKNTHREGEGEFCTKHSFIHFCFRLSYWERRADPSSSALYMFQLDFALNALMSMNMVVTLLVALVLDNTVPGSRQERGVYRWSRAEEIATDPTFLSDYALPRKVAKCFCWAKCLGVWLAHDRIINQVQGKLSLLGDRSLGLSLGLGKQCCLGIVQQKPRNGMALYTNHCLLLYR